MLDSKGTGSTVIQLIQVFCLLCIQHDFLLTCSGAAAVNEQVTIRCKDNERKALLTLKKGLATLEDINRFTTNLSTWGSATDNMECCNWDGVHCSNRNGHVIGLKLSGLTGEISPLAALLEFHHLNMLDLSRIDFGENKIPEFIGSLHKLEHLRLDACKFSGDVPYQLGNLTILRELDLSANYLTSHDFTWLSNLSVLSSLDMSWNQFEGPFPVNIGQFSNLEYLDVSYNSLNGTISEVHLSKFHNLRSLDLSFSSLALNISSNWIPPFHLRDIGLAGCNIGPGFPTWLQSQLGNVTNLRQLDLSGNHLTYKDLTWLTNLTLLSKLGLSHNQFEGPFPDLKGFSLLTELDISHNRLTGQLPVSIGQFSELRLLDVFHNSLNGTISEVHLSKLHNLIYLDLSFNSLALNFSPNWIPPFQLQYIRLAGCNMGHRFPTWLRSQSNLIYLDLSSAGISDKLPNWLWDSFNHLGYLNLSHNQVSGSNLDLSYCHNSYTIDLSFNNFSGPLPSFIPNLIFLSLSGNMFSGSIQSICGVKYSNLRILDLSQNQFSGELPNCWENMTGLNFLNLNDNKFSGHLPLSLGSLTQLESLQFRNNSMTGELPSTLRNITLLRLIDGGGNELAGEIPLWMGTLDFLSILSLRQNNFSGSIPPEICRLRLMQILDLSENSISGNIPLCFNEFNLMIRGRHGDDLDIGLFMDYWVVNSYAYNAKVQWKGQQFPEYKSTLRLLRLIDLSSNILDGEIPKEIYGLSGLVSLNLSQNRLTGDVKSDIDQMEVLECLDLSRNKLSGKLPIGLAQLRFLDVLDLSSNSFLGEIPKSTQLQSFNGSSYAGNMELCGEPLPKCPENRPSSTDPENDDKRGYIISAVLGFVVGFWFVIGPLLYSITWRNAYFGYLSKIGDWLYVTVVVSHTRLRNYLKSTRE